MIIGAGKGRVCINFVGTGVALATQFQDGAGVTLILDRAKAMALAGELIAAARKIPR